MKAHKMHRSLVPLKVLKRKVSTGRYQQVRDALLEMRAEAEATSARAGIFRIAGQALSTSNDDIFWLACVVLSHFVTKYPQKILGFVRKYADIASDEQRTALATCLLEHLMGRGFDESLSMILDERNTRRRAALVDVLSRCWPFGEAELPSNWERVEALIAEYPKLNGYRGHILAMLRNGPISHPKKLPRIRKGI